MYCRFCGEFVGIGNAHTCAKEPKLVYSLIPPTHLRRWTVGGWMIVAFVLLTAALWLDELRVLAQLYGDVTQPAAGMTIDDALTMIALGRRADDIGYGVVALSFVYLVGYAFWLRAGRRLVAKFGDEGRAATRHWTFVAWRLSVVAVLLLSLGIGSSTAGQAATLDEAAAHAASALRRVMILGSVRCAVYALLVVVVLLTIRRVRALAQMRPVEPAVVDPAS